MRHFVVFFIFFPYSCHQKSKIDVVLLTPSHKKQFFTVGKVNPFSFSSLFRFLYEKGGSLVERLLLLVHSLQNLTKLWLN
jgi:hypothetical protein